MSNFSSLDEMRRKAEEEAKKRNEYYAGGHDAQSGGGSGLSILGPPSSNDDSSNVGGASSMLDGIIGNARNNANELAASGGDAGVATATITLYHNGFVVNDGPFRDYTTPENVAFMGALLQGDVPPELRALASNEGKALNVAINDKRGENYTAPAYIAFGGESQTLGGTTELDANSIFSPDQISDIPPVLDESAPTTTVQIRLKNGKKIRVKLNHTHKVADLLTLIKSHGGATDSFSLSSGFPPKDVCGTTLSLEEAGLIGAAVTQK